MDAVGVEECRTMTAEEVEQACAELDRRAAGILFRSWRDQAETHVREAIVAAAKRVIAAGKELVDSPVQLTMADALLLLALAAEQGQIPSRMEPAIADLASQVLSKIGISGFRFRVETSSGAGQAPEEVLP